MINEDVARRLDELGTLLESQGANVHRVRAYRRAAETVRKLDRPVLELAQDGGLEALRTLRGIGPTLGRAILILLETGRLPMLERLRHEVAPRSVFASLPGVGPVLARRFEEDLGLTSLEELETAAHDGRLADVLGVPAKTVHGIIDSLAARLNRVRPACSPEGPEPPVEELLEIDREYRRRAAAGELRLIAPRRFNPEGTAWLPVLNMRGSGGTWTALFSNTARAHELDRTSDWVVLYADRPGGYRQYTVVTETRGRLAGMRVVRGREADCEALMARYHRAHEAA